MVTKLKIINSGSNKLALIKGMKMLMSIGLKEAKEFVDSSACEIAVMNVETTHEQIQKFKEYVDDMCDGLIYELNDQISLRNRKLIELGMYDNDDLISEMVEMDIDNILAEKKSVLFLRKLLTDRYSKLPEDYIKEMIKIDTI